MQSAFTHAQRTLAQLQGMASGAAATNTTLADGTTCVGVYGQPQIVEIPLSDGGFRRRAELPLTITRDQLDEAPESQTNLTRTDLTPNRTYRIESVSEDDSLVYLLTLVRSGE
jgi:hypothetical protein